MSNSNLCFLHITGSLRSFSVQKQLRLIHMNVFFIFIFAIFTVFVSPYSVIIFGPEMSAHYVCCIYSNEFQIFFITEANSMNQDQTAPKGAV